MVIINIPNKPGNLLLPLPSPACLANTETSLLPSPCAAPIVSLHSSGIAGPFGQPFPPSAPLHLPGVPGMKPAGMEPERMKLTGLKPEGDEARGGAAPEDEARGGAASPFGLLRRRPRSRPRSGSPEGPGPALAAMPGGRGRARPARSCRSAAGSVRAGKFRTPLAQFLNKSRLFLGEENYSG